MQQTSPFDLLKHARDFQYDYVTVVDGIMSHDMCQRLRERINEIIANGKVRLVNHQAKEPPLSQISAAGTCTIYSREMTCASTSRNW